MKRDDNAKWIVAVTAALVLGAVLAVPLGLSLVALLPPLLLAFVVGIAYTSWRHRAHRAGLEKNGKGGMTELVGGRAARESHV